MGDITQKEAMRQLEIIWDDLITVARPGGFDTRRMAALAQLATARVNVLRAMWDISGDHGLNRRADQ